MQVISKDFERKLLESVNRQVDQTIRLIERKYAVRNEYFSKTNACTYADIEYPTLEKWIKQGLPISKVGGKYLIKRSDLDEFILKHLL